MAKPSKVVTVKKSSGAAIGKKRVAKPKSLEIVKLKKVTPANASIETICKTKSSKIPLEVPKLPANFVCAPKKLVSEDQVRKGTSALFQYIKNSTKPDEALLFNDEKPIFLQITSMKVPKTPIRVLRLGLPHSLLTDSSEICLIVKDIGKPKEHDETIEHYEQLLNKHGITNIKTILPYHQFKTEYANQFELKRNLLGLYDCFLVDARVSGYVTKLLGKIFMEKRKMPASIKMELPYLKRHIETALNKTALKIHSSSDSFITQVGHSKMEQSAITENIIEVVDQLCNEFPGESDNIRALSIKTDKSIAIPIFLTLRNKNEIPVPVIHSKRPKLFHNVAGELTTRTNKEITVLPSGKVIVHTVEGTDDEEEEEDDIQT